MENAKDVSRAVKSKGRHLNANFKELARKYKRLYFKSSIDFIDIRNEFERAQSDRNQYMRENVKLREENSRLRELCELRAQDFMLSHSLLRDAEEKNKNLEMYFDVLKRDLEDANARLEEKMSDVYPEFMKDYELMRKELEECTLEITTNVAVEFEKRLKVRRVHHEGLSSKVVPLNAIDEVKAEIINEAREREKDEC